MKLLAIVLLGVLAAASGKREHGSHPIASVQKLLKELWLRVEKEGEDEQATWMKFKKWCTDSQDTLNDAVQSDKDDIDTLSDTVDSKTKEKKQTEDHISFLEDEIGKYEAEAAAAKKDRDAANKIYKAADTDFETTIKAVDDAVKALSASKNAAFLQFSKPENPSQESALRQLIQQPLVLEQLSDEQREALSAAVYGVDGKPVTEADILAKEAYAKTGQTYTFKSGTVITLLDSLKTHFKESRQAATAVETFAENDFQVNKEARKDAISTAKTTKGTKTTLLGEVTKDLNTATSDLKDEKSELESDLKTLKDTTTTCNLKASQFKERTELRTHEMEAMKAAIKILGDVSGVQTEAPDTKKAPTKPGFFFLQLDDPKMKAVTLLRKEASAVHSKALSRFAEELYAKLDGPFDAVNNMVQKMIFRLMDEQKKEDEHKHWCDLEVSTSKTSEKDKDKKIKSLTAKIKDGKARSDELIIKIGDLDKKVADLAKFMAEATETRAEGKKENEVAIKDAEDAQAAIAKAEAVLTSYYKDSGMIDKEPWEFLQIGQGAPDPVKLPKNPASWDASYTGVTDPTKADTGVIAVLQATAADFARMEADTRAQEISDQKQFDEDHSSSAIDKAKSQKESEMKTDENKRTLDNVKSMEKQKKHTVMEHEAVTQYLKDLRPACIDGDSKYEDRKKARDAEIEALGKAQGILENAFEDQKFLQLQTVRRHA